MKILFIHKGLRSFVKKDLNILKQHFRVKDFFYDPKKGIGNNLIGQIKIFSWLLRHIWSAKVIYIWFADYHAFIPTILGKILSKKVYIALGGYDTTYIPELEYGVFSNPFRKCCAGYAIKNATYLLPVDERLISQAKKFVPNIKSKIKVVDFGFDPDTWFCTSNKENIVLTVANINSPRVFKIKGIDFFVEVAKRLPQFRFRVVGVAKEMKALFPDLPNLEIFPLANVHELKAHYSKAKIYAQFSIHEGLPNVVCEAMLCECIPIVTDVNGMPRQVGNCGFVIKERSPEVAAKTIMKAMDLPINWGKKCRDRVIKNFPLQKREKLLIELLKLN
ncbi:MAG: glycosyltransferase family 4 protein [Calditrichaeota bacterium]|nr:glycosyltransferase family 4 protein [Calditrichota bacterium]